MSFNSTINIALAEDHDLFRNGLISMLSTEDDFNIVFDVNNGSSLLGELKEQSIDVLLLDIEMPIVDGLMALKSISAQYKNVNVIMLSSHYNDQVIYDCIARGAKGFLPKNSELQIVIDAIRIVAADKYYFDEKVSPKLISDLNQFGIIYPNYETELLSCREQEILPLICTGKTNREMAVTLNISIRTIENHRNNVFLKTNTKNAQELLIYSLKAGLFQL
ncbi:MAG: DNA-binding NarL/FixJ family response regulator [Crocinitomicaceae bacterium]|jgi:DNA-binding NarL/FixJ family response regulator